MTGFNDAVKRRLANKFNDWAIPKGVDPGSDKAQNTAQARFASDFFGVHSVPKFKIERGASVYTIGSCFARNVEQALLRQGMVVPTTDTNIDPSHYVSPPRFKNTVLNKYNPASMSIEILRGLGRLEYPGRGLVEISADKYYDPNASHLGVMSRDSAVAVRDELDRVAEKIKVSDVFLFTLGLTESWFDRETGIPFNQINPAQMRPIRDRLVFENATVQSAYASMAKALVSLKEVVPVAKVVVTVSPVPLLNTFTEWDIVVANTYSKSTLRVVASMLSSDFDFVDYYPSFEMVTNSARSFAWGGDQAHVTDAVVSNVIASFVERYVS